MRTFEQVVEDMRSSRAGIPDIPVRARAQRIGRGYWQIVLVGGQNVRRVMGYSEEIFPSMIAARANIKKAHYVLDKPMH